MNRVIARLAEAAKALVGAATPIVTVAITDVATELATWAQGAIAAAATTVLVWLTPNRKPPPPIDVAYGDRF